MKKLDKPWLCLINSFNNPKNVHVNTMTTIGEYVKSQGLSNSINHWKETLKYELWYY